MKKIIQKIAGLALGLSLAVGVGISLGGKMPKETKAAEVTDTLVASKFAATSTTYTNFSNVSFASNAVYAGNNAKTSNGGIQLRSKNSNSGIVTTASGGTLVSISIKVESGSNKLDVYGKTSAYSSAADLYDSSKQGTKIGSTDATGSITLSNPSNYSYIGLRSNNGALYLTEISIVWDDGSGGGSTKTTTVTSITPTAEQTIDLASSVKTVKLDASVNAGTTSVTSPAVTWTSTNSAVATVSSDGLVTGLTVGTTTIKANYAGDETYEASSANKEINVIDSNAKGGLYNPYTVAEARAAIDAGTGLTNVYATGIISQIDSYSTDYHSITYWISADGTKTNQLEVYSGKNLNNTNFNAITDIGLGATVKVYGTLKKFGSTYEFDKNNYLVSYEAPAKCSLTYDADGVKTGTVPATSTSYNSGTEITVPGNTGNLSLEGYTFVGWNDGATTYSAGDKFNISANTTLSVVFSRNSGTKGSESNPYSVAEARAAIDDGQGPKLKDACVSGLVSQVDSYSSQYKSITYWISADGTTTDQLQVYSGKGLNGADFSAETDVEVGATVVVCGLLKLHNSTYEFDKNNVQVSYTAPSAPVTYTVTYDANGGTGTMTDSTKYAAGATVTVLTNAFSKEGYTFAGWKDQDGNTVSGSFTINKNTTLYAQWSENVEPQEGDWVLTNLADLTSSDVFVFVGNNGSTFALDNDNGTGSAPTALDVTIANDKITSAVSDDMKWNISGNATDGYIFYPNGSSETWLYFTNANNGVRVGTGTAKALTLSEDNYFTANPGKQRYLGIYNSSDWRCYDNTAGNIAGQTFSFYKFVGETPTPPTPTESTIVSGTFMYQEKQSLFVGDVVTLVVSAPEGCEVLYPSDANNYLVCDDTGTYDSSTKTASFDVLVDESVHADVVLSLVWFAADGYSNYTLIEETLQIVNPEGLANARTFAGLISDECHASTKDFETLEGLFADITETEKEWLINAHYSVSGSGDNTVVTKEDDTHYEIAEAMSRYDFMVENLGMENFLNKSGLVQNAGRININATNSESSTIIVVIVAITSITFIGVLLVIKRRRSLVK